MNSLRPVVHTCNNRANFVAVGVRQVSIFEAISVVALSIAVVTAMLAFWWRASPPNVAEVRERLSALENEFTDLHDRVGQWMRRESVRRMREGKQKATEEPAEIAPQPGTPAYKDYLRRLARANGANA